ncbi:hypothetical protein GHK86_02815 [Acidimicrobiaceae bacterium USS-CC1]|uniref:Uncharacterized protein n=1 Tax=Acidiferrimicrobium australe TaxID=2664430 RepID=A0ABW9QQN2_9ACTN|nr:hypothetical protein [Acidiferrimicrobium australe]
MDAPPPQGPPIPSTGPPAAPETTGPGTAGTFTVDDIDEETMQWIMEHVQRRVLDELERRGRYFDPRTW